MAIKDIFQNYSLQSEILQQAFWQGAGEKLKLCGILGANCVGKTVDCAGNCDEPNIQSPVF